MIEKCIGNYLSDEGLTQKGYNISTFDAKADDFKSIWKRCSMVANFWAQYYAIEFTHEGMNESDFLNVVAFILNELIENVSKYCDVKNSSVKVKTFFHQEGKIAFKIHNFLTEKSAEKFSDKIDELLTSDLTELYFQRLEEEEGSGLGYLTMMQDYGVTLGFCFTTVESKNDLYEVEILTNLEF